MRHPFNYTGLSEVVGGLHVEQHDGIVVVGVIVDEITVVADIVVGIDLQDGCAAAGLAVGFELL